MTLDRTSTPKVAIIGAGLTGLLAAHGLIKNSFDVLIFERDLHVADRPRDWTILLHWAMPLFEKLLPEHVVQKLREAICNPHLNYGKDTDAESIPVYNGETGALLFKNHLPGSRRVSRQRLRNLLAKDLDEAGVIRWGKRLTGFSFSESEQDTTSGGGGSDDGPVQLRFEDGSTYEADYVLGTDGASSKVRELLFNDAETAKAQPSGFLFATAIVRYGDAAKVEAVLKAHPVAAITMAKDSVGGCGVVHAGAADDLSQWTTMWVKIWRRDTGGAQPPLPAGVSSGQAAIDYLKASTTNLAEPFQSLVDWTPAGSECYIDDMRFWASQPFDNRGGRVTLAGDAAHPMLIYRGQGFQHAILDASQYLDALVKVHEGAGSRAHAVSAYDADMIERGSKAVLQSLQEAELSMDPATISKMLMATRGHGRSV